MGYNMGYPVFFLLLDVLPEYIQKTFDMTEDGRFRYSDLKVVREGQTIPKDMDYAVIIFNDSQYHTKQAYELNTQILSLNPNAKVMTIPVQG